ncbi:hypothetical protein HHX47_DHR5000485 [Lentinula edodes]|nr:hypothetical protein HHX47_DHR5000485 [Lentinula edodes]
MLIRNTVFPFLTLAISLSVQGAPTGSKPRGNSHIVIARNAAGFLERDAPFDDKTLFLRSGEHSQLEARQQQKGQKSGQQNRSSHNKNVVNSWGKNTDRNRRKKAKQRAKAKLRKAAANANSVHPAVTAKTVATPPHVGALKEPVQAPLTEAEKKLELEKATEKKEEEKKKDGGEAKKEEPKHVIPEHKETPAEKKEELNHLQTTEGEAPVPPTGADVTTAATAAVGSLAQLAPMIAQGMAAGGSAGASSAIANDVMGGGASGSPNSGSTSNAGSSSTGDGVPPSSTGSSSSSNSSGDTGSSGSDSSTSSNKGEGEKEGKGDEDSGKKEDDGTGDGKGDETGDGSDNGKGDESSNSEDDKKTDSKKKSPDPDSGHGSTEENGASTKSPKGNDGADMRKRGTDLYLRRLMTLD